MFHTRKTTQNEIEFISIEDFVPEGHVLRIIDKHIDFSFILEKSSSLLFREQWPSFLRSPNPFQNDVHWVLIWHSLRTTIRKRNSNQRGLTLVSWFTLVRPCSPSLDHQLESSSSISEHDDLPRHLR
ncbi:hypothetical protein KP78_37660 [Jeotgalibacillus soli]|uniref:Uncharacterized protein n=1 Tax=Jeotgalibacillus soli TaxID=889306 RepID=A0A0C2V4I5_9BACL|nr:hypothetical protein KP78_37660 [Jeotgalibacillus soli]